MTKYAHCTSIAWLSFLFLQQRRSRATPYSCGESREYSKILVIPVEVANSHGFGAKELNVIRKVIIDHKEQFEKAWHEYFN